MDKIKRNRIILAVFISLLMITSIAGFINLPSGQDNSLETKIFNGLEFRNIDNRWVTSVNNNKIALSFDPELTEKQDIINVEELNSAEKVYFSTNQNNTENLRIYQEVNSLASLLKAKAVNSCYEDNEECKNLPLKTCKDAKNLNKVVIIKNEKNRSIIYKNNCLEIIGTETEIIEFIDKLILDLLI